MWRQPDPPHIGLQFYYSSASENTAFYRLLEAIAALGGKFAGIGHIKQQEGIRDERFRDIFDVPRQEVDIHDLSDLAELTQDPNARLILVYMENASGAGLRVTEHVSYLSITEGASYVDNHPFGIWTEAAVFDENKTTRKVKKARKVGNSLYVRFKEIVNATYPLYGAIECECSILPPHELNAGGSEGCFTNFYVDYKVVNPMQSLRLQEVYVGAYFEDFNQGLYISTNTYFNPNSKSLNNKKAYELSEQIGRYISKAVIF